MSIFNPSAHVFVLLVENSQNCPTFPPEAWIEPRNHPTFPPSWRIIPLFISHKMAIWKGNNQKLTMVFYHVSKSWDDPPPEAHLTKIPPEAKPWRLSGFNVREVHLVSWTEGVLDKNITIPMTKGWYMRNGMFSLPTFVCLIFVGFFQCR